MKLFTQRLNRRRGLIYASLILAETAWLASLLLVALGPVVQDTGSWFFSLFFVTTLVVVSSWVTTAYQVPLELVRIGATFLAVLGILEMLRATMYPDQALFQFRWLFDNLGTIWANLHILLLIIVSVGYIWWRGLIIGQRMPGPVMVWWTLQLGFAGLVLALIGDLFRPTLTLPFTWILFFILGALLAMILAMVQPMAEKHGEQALGALWLRFGQGILILGGVLGLALVLSWLFSVNTLDLIFGVLGGFIAILLKPVEWLLIAVLPYVEAFFEWLTDWILSLQGDVELATPTPAPTMEGRPLEELSAWPEAGSPWWWSYAIWVGQGGFLLMIIYLLYRLTRLVGQNRMTEGDLPHLDASHERVGPDGFGLGNLLDAGRRGLARLVGQWQGRISEKDLQAAATIRRIYAAMAVLTAQEGLDRGLDQTPLEFLDPLSARWPALKTEFETITKAYINVHYGTLSETQSGLERVQEAWKTVYNTIHDFQHYE